MASREGRTTSPTADSQLRPFAATAGNLMALCGLPLALSSWLSSPIPGSVFAEWRLVLPWMSALSLFVGGVTISRHARWGRFLASFGVVGSVGVMAGYLASRPLATLLTLLAATTIVAMLWNIGGPLQTPRRVPWLETAATSAGRSAILLWLLTVYLAVPRSPGVLLGLFIAFSVATGFAVSWLWRATKAASGTATSRRIVTAAVVLWPALAYLAPTPFLTVCGGLPAALAVAVLLPKPPRSDNEAASWWEPLLGRPEWLLVGTFAGLCAAGTLLLALPQSAQSGHRITLIDAAFTSVSAVCVTGLIVLDTPVAFTRFGQVVLLLLIQLGGLGIMTFATAALRLLGRRMSMRQEGAAATLLSTQDRGSLFEAASRILCITLGAELLGAVFLCTRFLAHGDSLGIALWRSIFTSVSAFCNAGFALQSDNLIPYQGDASVLHAVAALIILGGLSPAVILAVPKLAVHRRQIVTAQVKIALVSTAVLLVTGFVLILALEWSNTLGNLPIADRLHNAWFQSVTLRTAGFNSIDLASSHDATLLLMMMLMFVGGCPGGTAGGIKTTTLTILTLSVVNAVRGSWGVSVFGRRLPDQTLHKAGVIATLGIGMVALATFVIQLTQQMPLMTAMFEVVSALATVGLSIGGTSSLDGVGKICIITCMFLGRVGTLSLLMLLGQSTRVPTVRFPPEDVDIG